MRRLLVALGLLASACAHRQLGPDGEPLWTEVRTPSFVVLSDAAPAEAEAAARKLEQVRAALLAGSWSAKDRPAAAIRVVLLADAAELREVLGRSFAGFATQDALGRPMLVASLDQSPEDVPVLVHELAHAIHRGFLLRSPRWLAEGLATYLETLHLEDGGATALIGNPAPFRLRALGPGLLRGEVDLRLGWLLRLDAGVFSLAETALADWYARAWLLTHFLVDQRPRELADLLARLGRAEDPAAAFAAAFPGLTLPALEEEVKAWLRGGRLATRRVPVQQPVIALQTRPLPAAEALAARAELSRLSAVVFKQADARARAETLAARAHAADPGLADAVALLVALRKLTGAERTAAARAVADAHPDDWRGPALLAEALDPEKDRAERVRALEKAAALGASEAGPLSALAWHRATHGEAKKALPLAEQAVLLAPGNPAVLDIYAVALAAAGRCADALAVNRRALEVVPDGAPPDAVESLRNRADEIAQACKARGAAQAAPAAPPIPVLSEAAAQPRRVKCKAQGPLVTAGKGVADGAVITVHYDVSGDGHIANYGGSPADPPAVLKAIRAFLEGCRFELPPGAKPPVRVEEAFTFGAK